jgi:hypothetical protein
MEKTMSGQNIGHVLGSSTITTSGAVVLPHTAGNQLGTILALSAITIGVVVLVSQMTVHVLKRYYR